MTPTFDRLPPHDIDAEVAVIGSCLVDRAAIAECAVAVQPEAMFREIHAWTYAAILDLWSRGEDVNIVTVAHELARRGQLEDVGGQTYLSETIRRTPTSIGARWYAETVNRDYRYRRLIQAATAIMQMAYEAPPEYDQVIDRASEIILREGAQRARPLTRSMQEIVSGVGDGGGDESLVNRIEQFLDEPTAIRGVPTGWDALDQMLNGLERTRVYTVLGDTSVGKSALTHWMLLNVASAGYPALLFTTEMSGPEVAERMAMMHAGVDPVAIRERGEVFEDERIRIYDALDAVARLPVYICDVGRIPLATLVAESRRQVQTRDVQLIAIDHLQHITHPELTGVARMEEITAATKGIAMNERVPVWQVSHINRANSTTGVISLHAGKGASSIEQDSNVQIALEPVRHAGGSEWELMPELEAEAFLRSNGFQYVRARVNKNRSGGKSWDVRRFDWRFGGRWMPLGSQGAGEAEEVA